MRQHLAPRSVLHVDLADRLPDLEAQHGRGVFVVFWRHGVPLGSIDLNPVRLPLSSVQLGDLAVGAVMPAVREHLFAAEAECDVAATPPTFDEVTAIDELLRHTGPALTLNDDGIKDVSVVICTRDRAKHLQDCLDALLAMPSQPLEIVVVDNAPSNDDTRRIVAMRSGVRYIHEPRPGLDIARNTGIEQSRGAVIAYTDDDVTVQRDWTARIAQAFSDPSIDAVTGLVLPSELETEAQVTFEKFWSLARGFAPVVYDQFWFAARQPNGVPVWEIGAGANMAFRRTALHRVGGFDERLDAGAAGCSGDSEIWYRILSSGGRIRYEPTVVVHHRHRRGSEELSSQLHHYMRGHAAALLVQFERHRDWGNVRRLVATLPAYYARLAARRLCRGADPRTATLLDEMTGLWAGCRYYARTRRGAT